MSFGSSVGMELKCSALGQGSNTEGNPLLFVRGLVGIVNWTGYSAVP